MQVQHYSAAAAGRQIHPVLRPPSLLPSCGSIVKRLPSQRWQLRKARVSSVSEDVENHETADSIAQDEPASPTACIGADTEPQDSSSDTSEELKSHTISVSSEEEEDFFATKELVAELKSNFGERGEAWFFAQLAAIALVIFPPLSLLGLIDLVGTLSLTAGIVFIVYGALSLGRNLSPMPQPRKKHSLVTTGMYGYVRHPMYSGLMLAAVGLAAVTHSEARLALAALLAWVLERKACAEERALSDRYPEYEQYKGRVKKFVPFLF